MNLTLVRGPQSDVCTLGALMRQDGTQLCVTLELPWKDNTAMVSCIPAGTYECQYTEHPIHGWVYQVANVPNRNDILLHVGNIPQDTEGCILLGSSLGSDFQSITGSKVAFGKFMAELNGTPSFTLDIRDP